MAKANKAKAKRKTIQVKKDRGDKRALKEAAIDWMAGPASDGNIAAKQPHVEPAFQLNELLEETKPAAVRSKDAQEEKEEEERSNTDAFDEMESEEEDDVVTEAQIVTPSSKGPPKVDVPTTVKQYQAMIKNYQAQLERAERQICSISKTSLADKFLENEVRKYVKEGLWKRCKFITCRETMEECMNEVADQFAIEGNKKEHWKSTYEHAVRDALNNRRNNTAQDLKKELIGM
jgi:hypothetical protein